MNFLYFKTVFNHLKRQRVKSHSTGCSFPPGNSLWTFLLPPVLLFLSLQRTSASLSLSLSVFLPTPTIFPLSRFLPYWLLYPPFLRLQAFHYAGQYAEHSWLCKHSEFYLLPPIIFIGSSE